MLMIETQAAQIGRGTDDSGGVFATPLLHLTQSIVDINTGTSLADLTAVESDYNTYAAQTIVWDLPSVALDGQVEVVSVPLVFRPTDGVAPQSVIACFISNDPATALYFAGQFEEQPIPMESTLNQIVIVVRYRPASKSLIVTID